MRGDRQGRRRWGYSRCAALPFGAKTGKTGGRETAGNQPKNCGKCLVFCGFRVVGVTGLEPVTSCM